MISQLGQAEPYELIYSDIFYNKRVIFAALAGLAQCICLDSLGPTLILRMNDYAIDPNCQGLVFILQPTTLVISIFLGPVLVPKWVPLRVILITSVFLMALTELVQAPFFADQNLAAMLLGLFLSGLPMG